MTNIYPFSALYSIPNIEITQLDFAHDHKVGECLFHSYFADITRIKKLKEHGGVWFDMDILFLKPFDPAFLGLVVGKTVRVCSYSNTISTGIVVAAPNSPTLIKLSQITDEYIEERKQENFESKSDYKEHYQAFGPDLWRRVLEPYLDANVDQHPDVCSLAVHLVYPYLWDKMADYFEKTDASKVNTNTLGVHWYNGSTEARLFINNRLSQLDFEKEPKTPIEKDLHKVKVLGVDVSIPRISDFTTSLRGSNLQGVNLQNANLENADLRDTNLTNANLQNANLRSADLRGANLSNANLSGANMTNAVLEGITPSGAVLDVQRKLQRDTLGVSIIIACHNRKAQMTTTLNSIARSVHPAFEVIIVDDGSDEEQALENVIVKDDYPFSLQIITISKKEKTWINPCAAYNIGIRYAANEVIVLQNAEVVHVGDVLSFVARHITPKDWISFNCYGLNEPQSAVYASNIEVDGYAFIQKQPQHIGGNSVARSDPSGWLNHYDKHFVAYHYCGAIFREDLFRVMDGGFSSDFENLIGGDDDEFIKRLIFNKFNFKISPFDRDHPFTIHLHHEKPKAVSEWSQAAYERSKTALAKSLIKMGFAPENDIAKAPQKEIPMARRVLVP